MWLGLLFVVVDVVVVLVLALVLVVAARGGRGDVAAQPLYERAVQPLVLA